MFRKIIKKLSNFRFTSLLAAIISSITAIYSLASFFLFHFAGDLVPGEKYIRAVGFYEHDAGGILSLIVFLGFIFSLIFAIIVVYSSVPFIKNNEKLLPKKNNLLMGFISGIFELVLLIMMIILLTESPKTSTLIFVSLPFGILSTLGSLLYLIPFLKCSFFMPEIKR